jgi:predicted Zn finger-like uncharacterized protein
MFKVVPDQLRISDGWVRCGQCDEVFDANAHLHANASESGTRVSRVTVESPPVTTEPQVEAPGEALIQPNAIESEPDRSLVDPLADARPGEAFAISEPSLEAPDAAEAPASVLDAFGGVDVAGNVEFAVVSGMPQGPDEAPHAIDSDVDGGLSFMRGYGELSKWSHPVVRSILVILCLLFGVSLMLQVMVQERDRLVAGEPAMRPVLESMCAVLTCKVEPLRQIEAVVIDSSSFIKVRADVYRLNVTLKNTIAMDVATPALELTLTDMQDQPVIRRVIFTGDFGLQQGVLRAGAELTASMPISVRMPGSSERVSGYRLLAFYP